MNINFKTFSIVIILLFSIVFIPNTTISQDIENSIIYASPYIFTEYSQFTAQSASTFQWLSSVQSGLFSRSIDKGRNFDFELAENLSISKDKKVYDVTLKKDLKFSDGTELTADDVVFTYHALLSPSINMNSYSYLSNYFINESIYKIDNFTIRFELEVPYAFTLALLSSSISPKSHFEDRLAKGDFDWNKNDLSDSISAGPFKIDSFDSEEMIITVSKNQYYWNANNVVSDYIIFKNIDYKSSAITALEKGDVDILDTVYNLNKNELENIINIQEDFNTIPIHKELAFNHLNDYYGTGKNLTIINKIEGAKKIRKAISTIIDRDYYADDLLEGKGLPAATIVSPSTIGWDGSIKPRKFSVNDAKILMEDAGFNYSALKTDEFGNYTSFFFNVTLLSAFSHFLKSPWSTQLARTLPKIGINVTENVIRGWGEIMPRTFNSEIPPLSYAEGGYDLFFIGYYNNLDFDPTGLYEKSFLRPNGDNIYNFVNEEYESILKTYIQEIDLDKRLLAFKELQSFYYEWEIVAPIVYPLEYWVYSEKLLGWDSILLSMHSAEWDRIGFTEYSNNTESKNVFLPFQIFYDIGLLGMLVLINIKSKDRNL